MILILSLVLVVLIGLGLYAGLIRRAPDRSGLSLLGPGVILLAIAGIGMLRLLPTDAAEHSVRTYTALGMLWVGWIGLAALLTQMMDRRMPDLAPAPALFGAATTTAPVIGFLIAMGLT
ncbi:hypothetical protein [Pseudooceanicola sp.]|uniref:hypothetical protein n=1 Tax=Pseudooceanicola sp. TaxID=1914328 RepID=UPI0035C7256B